MTDHEPTLDTVMTLIQASHFRINRVRCEQMAILAEIRKIQEKSGSVNIGDDNTLRLAVLESFTIQRVRHCERMLTRIEDGEASISEMEAVINARWDAEFPIYVFKKVLPGGE